MKEQMRKQTSCLIFGEDYPLWLIRRFIDNDGHDETLVRNTLGALHNNFHLKNRVLTESLSSTKVLALNNLYQRTRTEYIGPLSRQGPELFQANADAILLAFILGLHHGASFSSQIETAWIRRMVLRAVRRGAHRKLSTFPDNFWKNRKSSSIVWRHAMPRHHISWQLCREEDGRDAILTMI